MIAYAVLFGIVTAGGGVPMLRFIIRPVFGIKAVTESAAVFKGLVFITVAANAGLVAKFCIGAVSGGSLMRGVAGLVAGAGYPALGMNAFDHSAVSVAVRALCRVLSRVFALALHECAGEIVTLSGFNVSCRKLFRADFRSAGLSRKALAATLIGAFPVRSLYAGFGAGGGTGRNFGEGVGMGNSDNISSWYWYITNTRDIYSDSNGFLGYCCPCNIEILLLVTCKNSSRRIHRNVAAWICCYLKRNGSSPFYLKPVCRFV